MVTAFPYMSGFISRIAEFFISISILSLLYNQNVCFLEYEQPWIKIESVEPDINICKHFIFFVTYFVPWHTATGLMLS